MDLVDDANVVGIKVSGPWIVEVWLAVGYRPSFGAGLEAFLTVLHTPATRSCVLRGSMRDAEYPELCERRINVTKGCREI